MTSQPTVGRIGCARLEAPVEPYLGLTLDEARELAVAQGRLLRVGIEGRMDKVTFRVRIDLDQNGLVRAVRAG